MRVLEVFILGFMLMAIPVTVLGTPNDPAVIAMQEGDDLNEKSMP